MSDDVSLFGDDEPAEQPAPPRALAAAWQVELIRKSLDAHGLTSAIERHDAIERVVGRRVEALQALTNDEALRVVSKLGRAASTDSAVGSAWDQRDEDTWIDRL